MSHHDMSNPLIITSADPILSNLNFEPYLSTVERRVVPFLPASHEPQTMDIATPWGAKLTAEKYSFLVSEVDTPNNYWPVEPKIFEESYIIIRPGYAVKKAVTFLVPLTDLTKDPDRKVTVISLEGPQTVRAGDFFLARGVKGEIWPIPRNGIDEVMVPAEEYHVVFQSSDQKSKASHKRRMSSPLILNSTDTVIDSLNFKPYYTKVNRRVVPFMPAPGEPRTMEVVTPWGETLTASYGDFLVSEVDTPDNYWPIDPVIFEESYIIIRPGYAVKKAVTFLVPLTDVTKDPERKVTIVTMQGPVTVRAGDFFLAKGVKDEIWPIPKQGIEEVMIPADGNET